MPLLLHLGVGGPVWLDWSLHVDALILVIVLGWCYAYAVNELRPRVSDAGRVKRSQVLLFVGGLAALFAAGGTPLHDLGERYWLSAHMTQHLLFTLVAPPLLIAGTPAWLWKWLLGGRFVLPVARVLTRPLIAFSIFNALLVLTHLPPTVDLALRVGAFHFAIHAVLVLSAMLMWWPILSPLPELPRLSYPMQMGYLFLQSLLPSVIASFITFADSVVYRSYADAPRLLGISALADQQIAGGLMKVGGSIILWSFMAVVFFKWYAREESDSQEPRWGDIEAELSQLGLER
ncbi:MAG: cytochrome c oxidase assembly protein [Chloroflexi bacterium]|nr:cytochrome c oxidase assembly protein [Chloroflexota bacterium]